MTWATKRRFVIAVIGFAVLAALVAIVLIPTLYHSPSCSDRTQNQGEQGVDCGGPCAYLCSALQQAPIVRFTKVVYPTKSRADIIAYVENPNINIAARSVPYTVTLYAADQSILKTSKGTLDLFPSRRTPVYLPAFFTGTVRGARAFLTIDNPEDLKWFAYTRSTSFATIESPTISGSAGAPRITAQVVNTTTNARKAFTVVAVVYDSSANVIAASQTIVPNLASLGSTGITFTWSEAFPSTPARIEVEPVPTFNP